MSFVAKEAYNDIQQRYIQLADIVRRIVAEYKRSDEDARGMSTVEYLIEEAEYLTDADRGMKGQHIGYFELRQDDERLYWWGAEDGWKDPTEIGKNGVLTIDARRFAVGTKIILQEPNNSVLPAHEHLD